MNSQEKLQRIAIGTNELLSEYIAVHNKTLEEAGSFLSLFKQVNFKELHDNSKVILSKFNSKRQEINELRSALYNNLTEDQKNFLNCLSKYVDALRNAVDSLCHKIGLLYERSQNRNDLSWKEYSAAQKHYQDCINEYLRIGKRLNDIYKKIAPTSELSLDDISEVFLRKSESGKKYDSAKSSDDLLTYFAEFVCLSARSIMFTLKGPKRGGFILKMLRVITPKSYEAYWTRNNRLFSECVMVVVDRLRPLLIRELTAKDVQEVLDKAAIWGGVYYSFLLRLSPDEKKRLEDTLTQTMISHEHNPLKEDQEQIRRVLDAHGKKPTPKEIADLILAMQDPVTIIDPWDFIENWKRLKK